MARIRQYSVLCGWDMYSVLCGWDMDPGHPRRKGLSSSLLLAHGLQGLAAVRLAAGNVCLGGVCLSAPVSALLASCVLLASKIY